MTPSMTVLVNGEERSIDHEATVLDLLQQFELDPRAVVVEVNRTIVRRPTLGETVLHEGDRVELVHFVGGG
jgi:thiamine biosynthesis protein ThiS